MIFRLFPVLLVLHRLGVFLHHLAVLLKMNRNFLFFVDHRDFQKGLTGIFRFLITDSHILAGIKRLHQRMQVILKILFV